MATFAGRLEVATMATLGSGLPCFVNGHYPQHLKGVLHLALCGQGCSCLCPYCSSTVSVQGPGIALLAFTSSRANQKGHERPTAPQWGPIQRWVRVEGKGKRRAGAACREGGQELDWKSPSWGCTSCGQRVPPLSIDSAWGSGSGGLSFRVSRA